MSARLSFHSRHAAWQALQPMHFETSISLATGVSCRAGAGTEEAERRTRSASLRFVVGFTVFGLGSSNSNAMASSLRHRSGRDGLDVDQERLELRRFGIGVADIWGERIGPETLTGAAHKAPMQRDADDMDGLAVADHRLDALGHVDLGFHRAAFRPDADPAAIGDTLFLGQFFADFDEEFRLQRSIDLAVLGPIVEVLGETVGGRRVGKLLGVAELLHVAFEHARHRIAPDLGVIRWRACSKATWSSSATPRSFPTRRPPTVSPSTSTIGPSTARSMLRCSRNSSSKSAKNWPRRRTLPTAAGSASGRSAAR